MYLYCSMYKFKKKRNNVILFLKVFAWFFANKSLPTSINGCSSTILENLSFNNTNYNIIE
jgi:hypothetical protein